MTKARDLANGGFGLVLVKPSTVVGGTDNGKGTVNFTNASSVSLNNTFNSNYDFYRLIFSVTATSGADANLRLRFRLSGSDISTSSYYQQFNGFTDFNATDNFRISGDTSMFLIPFDNTASGAIYSSVLDVMNPFKTTIKTWHQSIEGVVSASSALVNYTGGGAMPFVSSSYDGITIFTTTGTATGSVSVYGYNK